MADENLYPTHCRTMRQAMRDRGWQQDVIALVMDHSRSTVNAILTGRQRLTARLALDYGFVLKLSPEELLRQQDEWLLSNTTISEDELVAIRLRAAEVTARVAGDIPAEIGSLEQQRNTIDQRIAHLTRIQLANDFKTTI